MAPIKTKMIIIALIGILVVGFSLLPQAVCAAGTEVTIDADGDINYDANENVTVASKNVRLVSGDIRIVADEVMYNGGSGLVKATGHVVLTTKDATYKTDSLEYNLLTGIGNLPEFQGLINKQPRNLRVNGESIQVTPQINTVTNAAMTRCNLPNPEYRYAAKRIRYDDQHVYLEHVVVWVKGVPVFYWPYLKLNKNARLPGVEAGISHDDGVWVKYSQTLDQAEHFLFIGERATKKETKIGISYQTGMDGFQNNATVFYNFSGWMDVADQLTYENQLFLLRLDGYHAYGETDENNFGFSLTRKYWKGPLGNWQVGVLARRGSKLDVATDTMYGGTYGGYRVDYRPHPYLTLSMVQLYSFNSYQDREDYRGYLSDYDWRLGQNLLYHVAIPLGKGYSAGTYGNYNNSLEQWVSRRYYVGRDTDCLGYRFAWNDMARVLEFTWRTKF